MNNPPLDSNERSRNELLREFFINALSLAFLNEAVLRPAPVPVRVEAEDRGKRRFARIPEYYRG